MKWKLFAIYYDKQKKIKKYVLEYFLLRIEHFIHFEIIKNLVTSMRTWPKLTGDIITDIGE